MSADLDPFALARRGEDDAELLALVAEYRRRENSLNEKGALAGLDDKEVARRCAESTAVRDKIDEIRPVTLRGVLAVLDLGSDVVDDPHWWPEEAIEGLRKIVEGP